MARAEDGQRPPLRAARHLRPRPDLRRGHTRLLVAHDLAELGAGWIAGRAAGRAPFRIALTGGSTPRAVYERLARLDLDWQAWQIWWSDEREVPPDDERSNERLARESLLDRVSVPEEQVHPLRSVNVELPDSFDLVLLGLGPDGHTASLYPGKPELEATEPIVYVPEPGWEPYVPRFSFTLAYLNAQPLVAFLVAGEEKRDVLARVLAGDEGLPAARLRAPATVVLADEAATPR